MGKNKKKRANMPASSETGHISLPEAEARIDASDGRAYPLRSFLDVCIQPAVATPRLALCHCHRGRGKSLLRPIVASSRVPSFTSRYGTGRGPVGP